MNAIPINLMTSSKLELSWIAYLAWLWLTLLSTSETCIFFPDQNIVMHANNIKLCFQQLKHYLDVMGTFSFIYDKLLFLQCGLMFGSNFSPASKELIQCIAEQLAATLFNENSLKEKHKYHLDKLKWNYSLHIHKKQYFIPAIGLES